MAKWNSGPVRRQPPGRQPSGRSARRGQPLTLGGLIAVLLVLAAVYLWERYNQPPRPAPDASIDYAQVTRQLDSIRVEEEKRGGYVREEWPHWLGTDVKCLNTREQALIRDSAEPAKLSPNGCSVVSGVWYDPYTGETFTSPRQVDIDHRVPLEEAYGSGGYDWPREKRAAYANDLTDPLTLITVSIAANRAKGSKGPEEWLPPRQEYLCTYVANWIAVKARWELTMDERERVTVGNIIADCRERSGAVH
ncbi:HNH endonuclease family protein [Azospirillum rugosum]|uniref:GmrSD restriction endonucleases C-terminal domain-containing protein n=1 Tax=Azospirillum rugosum TaxID=416170 RepID=A0ABS4SHJ7_9PROT|nr:HNH endonuclease family protein [Azospirillum rugosum]MBP2291664.1 hypothetical protein [Azospirillum rugosum]MDQ0524524.1 hypothetical protein [Azospirillum rugosum]